MNKIIPYAKTNSEQSDSDYQTTIQKCIEIIKNTESHNRRQKMRKITEQYTFNCMKALKQETQLLHIQVQSTTFKQQIYSKHYKYDELPPAIKLIFRNLPQIFVFLQKKDMVYFDCEDIALKLSILVAGEIKDFAIPLDSHCDKELVKRKIQYYEREKAKMVSDFAKIANEKQLQCEKSRNILAQINKEKFQSQMAIRDLSEKIIQVEQENMLLRRESEQKMGAIRQLAPKSSYGNSSIKPKPRQVPIATSTKLQHIPQHREYPSFPTNLQYEQRKIKKVIEQFTPIQSQEEILRERKIFWLTEIGKLKSESMKYLKTQINEKTDFQAQGSLFINSLKLANMHFVQIFINLHHLDLSNNNIAKIEGLKNLSKITKLNLSKNKISVIEGLFNLLKLRQLNLKSNIIMNIQNIFHLVNLQILDLSCNRIESIGVTISCLAKLSQLRLNNNQIRKITERVYLLKCLKVFSVLNNPFYQSANKSREIIDRLMKNGVKTAEEDIQEIDLSFC